MPGALLWGSPPGTLARSPCNWSAAGTPRAAAPRACGRSWRCGLPPPSPAPAGSDKPRPARPRPAFSCVARSSRPRPTRPNRPAAARAGSVSGRGGRPLFLEPLDQGIAADLKDPGDAGYPRAGDRGTLLIGSQDEGFALGRVSSLGGIGEGATTV